MQKITIKSPAKINLGLQVLNKRQDGYHNINTVFAKISLFDIIDFQPSDVTKIRTAPDLGIPQEKNLVYKAIELYRERFGIEKSLSATIQKNIPTGGGLGGGSSNAASALLAMNYIYGATVLGELISIAVNIGSDVPFFLQDGIATGKSRGEDLEYFNLQNSPVFDWHLVAVNPGIEVSTPEAYKSLCRGSESAVETDFISVIKSGDLKDLKNKIYNDFEESVFSLHPKIAEIKKCLYGMGSAFALMSGSGSTVFGIFEDYPQGNLFEKFPEYFSNKVKIIR